ncbi:Reverse transcriptase domain [Cinara cedri]|uniref:Reverse transcriptase domain n=1 Tax=Cinara cedri TaxID=506608 RepID=A0A5E4M6T2_9HEMI|nr:Reverse transcriptase domain [Cinara cedri]
MSQQQNTESKIIAIQKAQDARCKEITRICRKADQIHLQKRMFSESQELKLFTDIQRAKESQARELAELEQEQKLAQIMADIKHQEMVELKTNQLIRNNCLELRCAEKHIRTAEATKIIQNQIKEKEAIKKEEKARNYYSDLKIIEASKNLDKSETELQNRKKQMKLEYKNAILEQIRERAEKLLNISPRTPTAVDSINPKENGLKQRKALAKVFRKENDELIQIKNERQENERKETEKQDKRIEEYLINLEKRKKCREEIKKKKQEEKDKIYNFLINLKLSTRNSCKDSDIHNQPIDEQRLNANYQAAKHEKEAKILIQNEMMNQNEIQLHLKIEQLKKEKEIDFIESRKILQSNEQSKIAEAKRNSEKRQVMIEYGKELKETIDQRSILRNEKKKRLQAEGHRKINALSKNYKQSEIFLRNEDGSLIMADNELSDKWKAYYCMHCESLMSILEQYGLPLKLVNLMITVIKIQVGKPQSLSTAAQVRTRLRQGDALSPILFNLALEKVLQSTSFEQKGLQVGETKFGLLVSADDSVLLAKNKEEFVEQTQELIEVAKIVGLEINVKKTEYMITQKAISLEDVQTHLEVEHINLTVCRSSRNLDTLITQNIQEKIKARIRAGNSYYFGVNTSRMLSRSLKIKLCRTFIKPMVMYGCEI